MKMETGGDVGTYIRKYGIVSEKATTGLLKRIGHFFFEKKETRENPRKENVNITSNHKILTFCGMLRRTE